MSLKKTEVLFQPPPSVASHRPQIFIDNTELNAVKCFKYLGCMISSNAKLNNEIDFRLSAANRAFGSLHQRVWRNKDLHTKTKIMIYRAVIMTNLLYGTESWVLYKHHIGVLERFHQRCLRTILQIKWSDYVSDTSVLELFNLLSVEAHLLKSQLRWAGHVATDG